MKHVCVYVYDEILRKERLIVRERGRNGGAG